MYKIKLNTGAKQELIDVTERVERIVSSSSIKEGLCCVYVPHTTAGLIINESADPSVAEDILYCLSKLVKEDSAFRHAEGNSTAHIKSTLVGPSKQVFIRDNKLVLGTWQGIFFAEFDGPRNSREIWVDVR